MRGRSPAGSAPAGDSAACLSSYGGAAASATIAPVVARGHGSILTAAARYDHCQNAETWSPAIHPPIVSLRVRDASIQMDLGSPDGSASERYQPQSVLARNVDVTPPARQRRAIEREARGLFSSAIARETRGIGDTCRMSDDDFRPQADETFATTVTAQIAVRAIGVIPVPP